MIKAAAIKKNGKVYAAVSHEEAIKSYLLTLGYSTIQIYTDFKLRISIRQGDYEEGFIATGGFFVNRKTAARIAFNYGQIKEKVSELSSGMIRLPRIIKMNIKTKLRLVNAAYLKARRYYNEEPQNIRYGESPSYWIAMFEISTKSTWAVIESKNTIK